MKKVPIMMEEERERPKMEREDSEHSSELND